MHEIEKALMPVCVWGKSQIFQLGGLTPGRAEGLNQHLIIIIIITTTSTTTTTTSTTTTKAATTTAISIESAPTTKTATIS